MIFRHVRSEVPPGLVEGTTTWGMSAEMQSCAGSLSLLTPELVSLGKETTTVPFTSLVNLLLSFVAGWSNLSSWNLTRSDN